MTPLLHDPLAAFGALVGLGILAAWAWVAVVRPWCARLRGAGFPWGGR